MPFDTTESPSSDQLNNLRIIRKAREQIAMDGQWCQGRTIGPRIDKNHQRCAVGWLMAIVQAERTGSQQLFLTEDDINCIHEFAKYFLPMIPRLPKCLKHLELTSPGGGAFWHWIIWYNDKRTTKQSDVVALFDRVIKSMEKQNAV